eukprot:m.88451 g.88451  ORF g.88451 m.88451 type:complete len:67 (+) comp15186_c0_seq1:1842-2042(+)
MPRRDPFLLILLLLLLLLAAAAQSFVDVTHTTRVVVVSFIDPALSDLRGNQLHTSAQAAFTHTHTQ